MSSLEANLTDIIEKRWPYTTPSVQQSYVKVFEYLGLKEEKSIDHFLNPSLKLFNHPFKMTDMEKAVDFLIKYLDEDKKILFFGDYDADGATTTALFVSVLRKKGYNNIEWFVPHRHKHGYGLNADKMKEFFTSYDLIVTGDTGIKEMKIISESPIPIIVTDHHETTVSMNKSDLDIYAEFSTIVERDGKFMAIPRCEAVVNPKRIDCDYPNEWLSGVAVIYKLLQGIFIKKGWSQMELIPRLDLVALGLVADLVPQIDVHHQDLEVRMMTAVGLKMMNEKPSLWVRSFQAVTGNTEVKFSDLGFNFGPRINAAGRLDSADPAVEFLLEEDDVDLSLELAQQLEEINNERKEFQQRGIKSSMDSLSSVSKYFYERIVVVEMEEQYHSGIAGLIASSLSGKYNVPAIVLCHKMVDGVKYLTGSCRSVEGISILDILIAAEKKFGTYRYGGHDAAAGLTIKADDFELFRDIIIGIANNLPNELYENKLFYDIEIPISEIDYGVVELIENSFQNIRLFSPDNEFYSPAGSLNNIHGLLFLEKDQKRVRAITFNRAAELLEDFLAHNPKSSDIVFQVSTYGKGISYRLDSWEFK